MYKYIDGRKNSFKNTGNVNYFAFLEALTYGVILLSEENEIVHISKNISEQISPLVDNNNEHITVNSADMDYISGIADKCKNSRKKVEFKYKFKNGTKMLSGEAVFNNDNILIAFKEAEEDKNVFPFTDSPLSSELITIENFFNKYSSPLIITNSSGIIFKYNFSFRNEVLNGNDDNTLKVWEVFKFSKSKFDSFIKPESDENIVVNLNNKKQYLKKMNHDNGKYLLTVYPIDEKVIAEKELIRHVKILKAISHSARILLNKKEVDSELTSVLATIGRASEVGSTFIVKMNNYNNTLIVDFISRWTKKPVSGSKNYFITTTVEEEETDLTKFLSETKFYTSLSNENDLFTKYMNSFSINSLLVIPIFLKEKLWGFMGVENLVQNKFWIETEIKALITFSQIFSSLLERQEYERVIHNQMLEAQKLPKLKNEFFAQMSHEIRTPINSLLNFTNYLKLELEDKLTDTLRDSFSIVDKAGKRIIRTINLLLNLADLQSGNYEFEPTQFDLNEDIINDLFIENYHGAKTKNISFKLVTKTEDCNVIADKESVKEIFRHLIDNSIKFTEKGFVKLIITKEILTNNLIVEVSDSGVGMSSKFLKEMFNPFTQEDIGYTRKFDGNGLGLTLVKKYCELNKLKLEYISEKNKGTTFRVIFTSP